MKKNQLINWIKAFRLKTLPLALSNTIIGCGLAAADNKFNLTIAILTGSTTLLLQIISNMANDYGDFINGKDTKERIGPKRMVQSGEISPSKMLRGIIIAGILCAITGITLIWLGTSGLNIAPILVFALLGLGAIFAAIKYTVGKNPYGYKGFGDIFVFIFFGIVGVVGTYFLQTQNFNVHILIPASAIGFLSTGVLNLNNMRDYESDKNANKTTLVVRMGIKYARYYHLFLVLGAIILIMLYTLINYSKPQQWLFILSLPILLMNIRKVMTFRTSIELYPELARLSLGSLLFACSFCLGILL